MRIKLVIVYDYTKIHGQQNINKYIVMPHIKFHACNLHLNSVIISVDLYYWGVNRLRENCRAVLSQPEHRTAND